MKVDFLCSCFNVGCCCSGKFAYFKDFNEVTKNGNPMGIIKKNMFTADIMILLDLDVSYSKIQLLASRT